MGPWGFLSGMIVHKRSSWTSRETKGEHGCIPTPSLNRREKGCFGPISGMSFMREKTIANIKCRLGDESFNHFSPFLPGDFVVQQEGFSYKRKHCSAIYKSMHLQRNALFSEILMAV